METDNLFFILDLPFTPIPNTETIEKAIAKKQSEWSRLLNNPRKKDNAKKWLENISYMRELLANPDKRRTVARQAQEIQIEKFTELEQLLDLNYSEEILSENDVNYLLNHYGVYQITNRDIELLYKNILENRKTFKNKSNSLEEAWCNISLPDPFQMDNVNSLLDIINKKTMYQFLNMHEKCHYWELLNAFDDIEKSLRKSVISDQHEICKKLCGFARDIFSSENKRQKYDNYLTLKPWSHLYKPIDFNAATNDKNVVQIDFLCRLFLQLPACFRGRDSFGR